MDILLVISNVKVVCGSLCGEQFLNDARLDCVLYGLVVVGINNILCKYILYICARYSGTLSVEYFLRKRRACLCAVYSHTTKLDTSTFLFRDEVFIHTMSLIDDDSNGIRDMLQANGIYTLLDILIMSSRDIEDIECRVNNKVRALNIVATDRLKI